MILYTNDGMKIMAESSLDVIQQLRNSSFDPRESLEQFMESTAEAAMIQKGVVISTYDYDSFIVDLKHNGFLLEEEQK